MAKTTSTGRTTTPRTSTASTLLYTFEREAIRPTRRLRRPPRCTPRFTPRLLTASERSLLSARSLPLRLWLPFPLERVVHRLGARRGLNLAAATQCASVSPSLRRSSVSTATTAPASSTAAVTVASISVVSSADGSTMRCPLYSPTVSATGTRATVTSHFSSSSGFVRSVSVVTFSFLAAREPSRGRPRTRRATQSRVRRWRRGVRRR